MRDKLDSLSRRKPNIIVFSVNSLTLKHMPCYGYHRNTTPHICNLARDGVKFENAISSSSHTPTAFPSFLTSSSPLDHKVYTRWNNLNDSFLTVNEFFGKEEYYNLFLSGDTYFKRKLLQGTYYNDTRDAEKIIERSNKPFMLIDYYRISHYPYLPPEGCRGIYNKNFTYYKSLESPRPPSAFDNVSSRRKRDLIDAYNEEIICADKVLGRYIEELKENGMYEDSFIVVFSDHGELFGEHDKFFHGGFPYEELINVPLIIKFPENSYAGKEINRVVQIMDIFPTLADYMGLSIKRPIEGKSMLPLIEGGSKEAKREAAYSLFNYFIYEAHSLRYEDYKAVLEYDKLRDEERYSFYRIESGEVSEVESESKVKELKDLILNKLNISGFDTMPTPGPYINKEIKKECREEPEKQPDLCYNLEEMEENLKNIYGNK